MAAIIPTFWASSIPPHSTPLYVGDLDPDVIEAQLFDVFSEFESLISVRLYILLDAATGKSRRYAHIHFRSRLDAEMAIKVKNHSKLNGKEILVMWSHRGNWGDSVDNGTNSSIQVSHSQQSSGQSIYVPPLEMHAGEKRLGVSLPRKDIRLSERLCYSNPEHLSSILRMEIEYAVEKLKPELSETTTAMIAMITGKIMEMDREEIFGLLETPDSLASKVKEVVEVLMLGK